MAGRAVRRPGRSAGAASHDRGAGLRPLSRSGDDPKPSEAATKGSIASNHCLLDVLALATLRSSVGYRAMAHNGMVRTLPKTRPGALGSSQHNLLLYRILAVLI